MRFIPYIFLFFISFSNFHCRTTDLSAVYTSESLRIQRLSPHTYLHTSYLDIPGYGPFPCNGLVYFRNGEAIVFDTPTTDAVSQELIGWIEQTLESRVVAVVVNHFHNDCLGGLAAFHTDGIPSYAYAETIEQAVAQKTTVPQHGFSDRLTLEVGGGNVINRYFGAGHTPDNIVSYIPEDRVLFGGCLLKAAGAGKGNLADADIAAWPETVARVAAAYPKVRLVVPGHGKPGTRQLFDYTIALFRSE